MTQKPNWRPFVLNKCSRLHWEHVKKTGRSRKLRKQLVYLMLHKLHRSLTFFQGTQELFKSCRCFWGIVRVGHVACWKTYNLTSLDISSCDSHFVYFVTSCATWYDLEYKSYYPMDIWRFQSRNWGLNSSVNHGDFVWLVSVHSFYFWLKLLVAAPFFVSFHFRLIFISFRSFVRSLIRSILSRSFACVVACRRNVEICQSSRVAVSEETLFKPAQFTDISW